MPRSSQSDTDGVVWQTAPLKLGQAGLDLRRPSEPDSLSKLLNARFLDERTARRRGGHDGIRLRDASGLPIWRDALDNPVSCGVNLTGWVYGHGQLLDQTNLLGSDIDTTPIAGRGKGTFNYDGADIVWTGDRLLVARRDGSSCLGKDGGFWNWLSPGTEQDRGVPAYLPVQTDSTPPDTIAGDYMQTALTATQQFYAATGNSTLTVWVVDRATGAVVDKSTLANASDAVDVKLFLSGSTIVCLWRTSSTHSLYISNWTGVSWSDPSQIDTSVNAFDVAPVPGGFHLLWRVGTALYIGHYSGTTSTTEPYAFRTSVTLTTITAGGPVALAVSPAGVLCAVFQTAAGNGLYGVLVDQSGVTQTSSQAQINADAGDWDGGLTCACRPLNTLPRNHANYQYGYPFVVHAAHGGYVYVYEFASPPAAQRTATLHNAKLASESFLVGNEVFCWMLTTNSMSHFLAAGSYGAKVCGSAEREEGLTRHVDAAVQALAMVNHDPFDPYAFVWMRPYNTGQNYARGGNTRVGSMQFLPPLSAALYGRSAYLAGSLVRNWDGEELGDAGFIDYPTVNSLTPGSGGSLSAGDYFFRVYAVRYNKRGERFQSAAVTSAKVTVTANQTVAVVISTLAATNHSDVVFEVYRTEAGGTAFYLEGTVNNNLSALTVSFTSTMADATLRDQKGDEFAPVPDGIHEIEGWAPLGCSTLVSAADRLWGFGGQVPSGWVQFSKLHEEDWGAGFDDLAGEQEIDIEGGAITSMIGFNDAIIVFEADRLYVMDGSGPDNEGTGSFSVPQIVLADGASTHYGTLGIQDGVVYWGTDGPRLLQANFEVVPICAPVRPLSKTLTPTGVRADLSLQEVVWYTSDGTALLWNYASGSRWAQWGGLNVAGCSETALVTPDGYLLTPNEDAVGDNGVPYGFTLATGNLRPSDLLEGGTALRRVGIVGSHEGSHTLRFRLYYDGSPLWSEQYTWEPDDSTWLAATSTVASLTPAQVDALAPTDHSGAYGTSKRAHRQNCHYCRVEISDVSSDHPTFIPYELSFEVAQKPGLGRTPVNTID